MDLRSLLTNSRNSIDSRPRWQLYAVGAVVLFVVVYVAWCKFSPKPQPQKEFAPAVAAKPVADIPTVPVVAPRVIYVYPKAEAGKKLGIPDVEADNPREQIIDAVDTKPGPKAVGSRVVTFINSTTGRAHSVVKDIPRPWAAFERGNELGVGYEVSTKSGPLYTAKYRRDIARIGSLYLHGEVAGSYSPTTPAELKGSVWGTYRW